MVYFCYTFMFLYINQYKIMKNSIGQLIGVGILLFTVSLMDLLNSGGNSYQELHWWGKVAYIGFFNCLGGLFYITMLRPLVITVYNKIYN